MSKTRFFIRDTVSLSSMVIYSGHRVRVGSEHSKRYPMETGEIGLEGDLGPGVLGTILDLGLSLLGHVVLEHLRRSNPIVNVAQVVLSHNQQVVTCL
jgi:hypothetical protein